MTTLAGASQVSAYVASPIVLRDDYTDPTIMALRVKYTARLTASPVASTFIALGIIAWTDPNASVPVGGDIPLPLDDIDMDWMARVVFPVPAGTTIGTLLFNGSNDMEYFSQAKRRMGNDKGLLAVFQQGNLNAEHAADVRYLLKE